MNSSDIVGSIYPSPTQYIGVATTSGGVSYTATSTVRASVQLGSTSSVTINSAGFNPGSAPYEFKMALKSGQSITVSVASGTAFLSIERIP